MADGVVELDVGRGVVDDDGSGEAEVGANDRCVSWSLVPTEDALDRRLRTGREDDAQIVLDERPFLGPKFDGARPWSLEPVGLRLSEDLKVDPALTRIVKKRQIGMMDHDGSLRDPAEVA